MAPLAQALIMFGVRAFPAARSLEDVFEQAFIALANSPPPAQKGNTKPHMEIAGKAATARGDQAVDLAKVRAPRRRKQATV